ncbi:hypothetical protein PMAC_001187 [Pneumocystis sp. 'macacae']|nr:hypothetical protein PMAC_001187 [Pneumocystis sp. 'macacae']
MASYLQHFPSSPTYSMASSAQVAPTVASLCIQTAPPLPKTIITQNDISTSIEAYQELLYAAKAYRHSLVQLSKTASSFGAALEKCARCKGVGDDDVSGFMLAGGMQYLIANHQQILGETLYRRFEIPLMEELDTFCAITQERNDMYQRQMKEKNKKIQEREAEHLRIGRKKQRDLATFRQALIDLSRLADDLERLKSDHYNGALDIIQETWSKVLERSALVIRAEVDIYEGIARKGWSGGGLEEIMHKEGMEKFLGIKSKLNGQYKSLTDTFSNPEDFDDYDAEDTRSIFSGELSKYMPIMDSGMTHFEDKNNLGTANLSSNNLLDINQKIQPITINMIDSQNEYYKADDDDLKNGFASEKTSYDTEIPNIHSN